MDDARLAAVAVARIGRCLARIAAAAVDDRRARRWLGRAVGRVDRVLLELTGAVHAVELVLGRTPARRIAGRGRLGHRHVAGRLRAHGAGGLVGVADLARRIGAAQHVGVHTRRRSKEDEAEGKASHGAIVAR